MNTTRYGRLGREVVKQQVHHLHHLAAHLVQPRGVLLDPFDALELEVAARVVLVGRPDLVRERGDPPALSICIIRLVPERGRPETIVTKGGSLTVGFSIFAEVTV